MKPLLPALLLSVTLSTLTVTPAAAYPVDCAILLCLAGGWPASAECAHARAVFIRRITPWPIEPPLQIWNCPMRASFRKTERSMDRLFEAVLHVDGPAPLISVPEFDANLLRIQDRADVDISNPAFDFVRRIRVYHIEFTQLPGLFGPCTRVDSTRVGTYGLQGDYRWADSNIAEVPPASGAPKPTGCGFANYRSVFIDWRDQAGNYGFEEVQY